MQHLRNKEDRLFLKHEHMDCYACGELTPDSSRSCCFGPVSMNRISTDPKSRTLNQEVKLGWIFLINVE